MNIVIFTNAINNLYAVTNFFAINILFFMSMVQLIHYHTGLFIIYTNSFDFHAFFYTIKKINFSHEIIFSITIKN